MVWSFCEDEGLDRGIERSLEEHSGLVKAIEDRKLREVEAATNDHVRSFRRLLVGYLSRSEATALDPALRRRLRPRREPTTIFRN